MRRITATLGLKVYDPDGKDRYNNPKPGWADPVPWPVWAIAPAQSTEPDQVNRDAVFTGLTVYAPIDGPRPGAHDLVVYRDEDWQVTGDVAEWDNNPALPVTRERGIVVNLDRWEG